MILCDRNNFRAIFFAWSPFVSTLFTFHVVSRTASEIVFAGNKTSRSLCPKCDRKECMDCLAGQNGHFQSQIVVYNDNNNDNSSSKIIAYTALFTIKTSITLYIRSIKSTNKIVINSHWELSLPNAPGKNKLWEEASPMAAIPES